MDKQREEQFVANFIVKNKRQRVLYELQKKDKRGWVIGTLSSWFISETVFRADVKLREDDVKRILTQLTKERNGYVIADDTIDAKTLPIDEAVEAMFYNCGASLLVCGENVAFYKDEATFGAPEKLILYKKSVKK